MKRKQKTQASNDKPKPDQRQRKDSNQSSTKNVTTKYHAFYKMTKASNKALGSQKTSCMQTKSNKS